MTPPEVLAWTAPKQDRKLPPATLSWRYIELNAAMEWKMTSDQFDAQSEHDKALTVAFVWAKNAVDSYNYHAIKPDDAPKGK